MRGCDRRGASPAVRALSALVARMGPQPPSVLCRPRWSSREQTDLCLRRHPRHRDHRRFHRPIPGRQPGRRSRGQRPAVRGGGEGGVHLGLVVQRVEPPPRHVRRRGPAPGHGLQEEGGRGPHRVVGARAGRQAARHRGRRRRRHRRARRGPRPPLDPRLRPRLDRRLQPPAGPEARPHPGHPGEEPEDEEVRRQVRGEADPQPRPHEPGRVPRVPAEPRSSPTACATSIKARVRVSEGEAFDAVLPGGVDRHARLRPLRPRLLPRPLRRHVAEGRRRLGRRPQGRGRQGLGGPQGAAPPRVPQRAHDPRQGRRERLRGGEGQAPGQDRPRQGARRRRGGLRRRRRGP